MRYYTSNNLDYSLTLPLVFLSVGELHVHLFKRPGPKPGCSDNELIAMTLIGECRSWHKDTELLSCWQDYRHLFPHVPSQTVSCS